MKDRIDPLIAERAPWLFEAGFATSLARKSLDRILSYSATIDLATQLQDGTTHDIMRDLYDRLGTNVTVQGLGNIPRQGPAILVANHPTGIADGIMLQGVLAEARQDVFFFANKDILRVMPQMADFIAPVEWRREKRSHGKTRETMIFLRKAIREQRLGVIFPSGRLAKRHGLQLYERPWMTSAAMIARKFELPVIPVNIRARNSLLFYLFDLIHPTLKDITLFHETLNKGTQPFRIAIGEPVSAKALPATNEAATAMLRQATLALGDEGRQTVSLIRESRKPVLRF